MIEIKTSPDLLNIFVMSHRSLKNSRLHNALILMSQDLESARYQFDAESWIDYTSPLKFRFTDRLLIFYRQENRYEVILNHILPNSDGVIVNLGGRALDINYLADNDSSDVFHPSHLKRLVDSAYKAKLPLVFAVEDIKDSFEPVQIFVKLSTDEDKLGRWSSENKPPTIISLDDDIWQSSSPTIQSIRDILNIPDIVPVLPYSYRHPISIQNILTSLLAEIEQNG